MSIDKLKTKFFTGSFVNDVKHYFAKINEIIDHLNSSVNSTSWKLDGNNEGSQKYIGTNDNYSLPFYTNNTEKMIIKNDGHVGINIDPVAKLHVEGDNILSTESTLKLDNSAGNPLLEVKNNGVVSVGRFFEIKRSLYNAINAFSIDVDPATENTLVATTNADLIFKTRSSGTVETMRMTNAGKIIINDSSYLTLGVLDPSTDKYAYIDSAGNATASAGLKFSVCQVASTSGMTAMQIDAGGNVGINSTAPTAKLQVVGLVEYADNATALGAGLTAGAFYRTGDFLKVVH